MIDREYENLKRGIQSILASAREEHASILRKEFIAQQPRLDNNVEQRMILDDLIKAYLDLQYDLYPMLEVLKKTNPTQYLRCYNIVLKVKNSVGADLSRLGLTLRPQAYVPMKERETFDPKAAKSAREKAKNLMASIKEQVDSQDKQRDDVESGN
ncbi:MAG: hypothetical protein WC365_05375 [Candidatus Babeliales bacterium]|jgi:hypothetical protein